MGEEKFKSHLNQKETETDTGDNDKKYKKILQRITRIQNHFADLSKVIGIYASKNYILRDKTDEMAKCVESYSKVEDFSTTSKLAMSLAAELLARVGDEQIKAIQRLEKNVLPNFSSYGKLCKCLKKDVCNAMTAQEKELSRRNLSKTFSSKLNKPKYRNVVTDAQREMENAIAESSRLGLLSQEQVIKFEHKRLMDLKEGMEGFFRIEIAKHAKSLELLTEAYKFIHSIDEDADLEALKRGLHLREIQPFKNGSHKRKTRSTNKAKQSKESNQIQVSYEINNSDEESLISEMIPNIIISQSRHSSPTKEDNRSTEPKERSVKKQINRAQYSTHKVQQKGSRNSKSLESIASSKCDKGLNGKSNEKKRAKLYVQTTSESRVKKNDTVETRIDKILHLNHYDDTDAGYSKVAGDRNQYQNKSSQREKDKTRKSHYPQDDGKLERKSVKE